MRFALIAVAVLAGAYTAAASPALTKIQDTLYKADGTRFEGVAQIEWKSFKAADGSQVQQQSIAVKITGGQLRVALVPTTNAKKPMRYTIKFNADGRTQFTEYWDVPPSTSTLAVENVRAAALGDAITAGGGTIDDIEGLRAELDVRPIKGTAFLASRAAVINASGALEGAIGVPGDCVRVDGTSGPCGGGPGSLSFMDSETPAGSIDGLNAVFSLAGTPVTADSLHLFRNGILLKRGSSYTIVGALITFNSSSIPAQGDVLQAWYRVSPSGTDSNQYIDNQVPSGAVDGSNPTFLLGAPPSPATSLQLYRNGLLQKTGIDFNLTGNVVTFTAVAVPQPGDIIQATYRR
jgi:hypothetical protein